MRWFSLSLASMRMFSSRKSIGEFVDWRQLLQSFGLAMFGSGKSRTMARPAGLMSALGMIWVASPGRPLPMAGPLHRAPPGAKRGCEKLPARSSRVGTLPKRVWPLISLLNSYE